MSNLKYICSIDEAANHYDILAKLYEEGMRIVRVNSAHPNCNIERLADNVSDFNAKSGTNLKTEIDLQGPKLRIVAPHDNPIQVQNYFHIGEDFSFNFGNIEDLTPGTIIKIRDGRTELVIVADDKGRKMAVPTHRFRPFYNQSGAYIEGFEELVPYLRDSDSEYIELAKKVGIDYIGASFLRDVTDLSLLRKRLEGSQTEIISKIENPSAIKSLKVISENSDLLMVARGDLSVTIGRPSIPDVQMDIINQAHQDGKPAIVASNFFQSLRGQEEPTYADKNDFSQAIFDGADYILFAGEMICAKENAVKYLKVANNTLKRKS